MKLCAIIPFYNHPEPIAGVVDSLLEKQIPCFIVDDGSDIYSKGELAKLAGDPLVTVVTRVINGGKGAAVIDGLRAALAEGYTHALQIDADGQHDANEIPTLVKEAQDYPNAIISGMPVYGKDVPKSRLIGRYATHIWVWINTLSLDIKDSMCGFRIYPIALTLNVINKTPGLGLRMDFDIEVLVRAYWSGLKVRQIPVGVHYPLDGISHFDVIKDNIAISKMHTKLFFGMIPIAPKLIFRKLRGR